MKELACQFGEKGRLHGILTLPAEARRRGLALVLLSAGLTAKCGPYRLYAEIARALAGLGCMALRFDLGGIGNSQIARPDRPLTVRTAADIRAALTWLEEQHGIDEFVIGGLCSGAEDAFRYAENDARVRGVILVDPHAYQTPLWRFRGLLTRYSINRIIYKILRTINAINVVKDRRSGSDVEGFEGSLINYQYMDRTESTRILSELVKREAKVHYIYTGGRIDTFHHKDQLPAMFPGIDFKGQVTVDHLPHIEHVQIFGQDRKELVKTITRRFSAAY